jgi:hypothetical protein
MVCHTPYERLIQLGVGKQCARVIIGWRACASVENTGVLELEPCREGVGVPVRKGRGTRGRMVCHTPYERLIQLGVGKQRARVIIGWRACASVKNTGVLELEPCREGVGVPVRKGRGTRGRMVCHTPYERLIQLGVGKQRARVIIGWRACASVKNTGVLELEPCREGVGVPVRKGRDLQCDPGSLHIAPCGSKNYFLSLTLS